MKWLFVNLCLVQKRLIDFYIEKHKEMITQGNDCLFIGSRQVSGLRLQVWRRYVLSTQRYQQAANLVWWRLQPSCNIACHSFSSVLRCERTTMCYAREGLWNNWWLHALTGHLNVRISAKNRRTNVKQMTFFFKFRTAYVYTQCNTNVYFCRDMYPFVWLRTCYIVLQRCQNIFKYLGQLCTFLFLDI